MDRGLMMAGKTVGYWSAVFIFSGKAFRVRGGNVSVKPFAFDIAALLPLR